MFVCQTLRSLASPLHQQFPVFGQVQLKLPTTVDDTNDPISRCRLSVVSRLP
ncbi:hypothetical protein [Scytonema sp. PCC 10023]|uniref:hypothetical protein n=1 Tax=Scytonema sp. PCC 10023 TaxID=1680591 RepID=UPI0039C703B9